MVELKSEVIKAKTLCQSIKELQIKKLVYPDVYIPNRSLAWTLCSKNKDDDMIVKIKNDIDDYNSYIDSLMALNGFWEFFKNKGYYISQEDCNRQFGEKQTDIIFSLKRYQFETDLCKNGKWLFLRNIEWKYRITVDGCDIEFLTEATDAGYPKRIKSGKKEYNLFWNWYDDERDFCFYFWEQADYNNWIDIHEDDEEPVKSYADFECYDQGRDCMNKPDVNIMRILKVLQDMGYLKVYYIEPESENPIWQLRSSSDGKIGLMMLDASYKKNSLVVEIVKLLFNCTEQDTEKYILTDSKNKRYLSNEKGLIGGHRKLKIYGKLDCPSANRYVKDGNYARHRVFFANEEIAINAGYRPCAKCMPEAYKLWKMRRPL